MNGKKTLLDKAKASPSRVRSRKPMSDEMIELFWAFIRGHITGRQAAAALEMNPSSIYTVFMECCRSLVADEELKPSAMLLDIEKDWKW